MGALKKKIFIIHGWAYSTDNWRNFIRGLKDKGYDPVMLGVPGLTTRIDRPWTIDDYVAWLDKKIGREKYPVLLVHSNGGRIALSYELAHPGKIGKLILIDAAGIRPNSVKAVFKRNIFKAVARAGAIIPGAKKFRNILYKAAREKDYLNANEVMRKTMANLVALDLRSKLSKIKTKTLIIWGGNDRQTPLSDGELMNSRIKNSKLYVVKGAGHSPHFTNTNEVIDIIVKNGI